MTDSLIHNFSHFLRQKNCTGVKSRLKMAHQASRPCAKYHQKRFISMWARSVIAKEISNILTMNPRQICIPSFIFLQWASEPLLLHARKTQCSVVENRPSRKPVHCRFKVGKIREWKITAFWPPLHKVQTSKTQSDRIWFK